MTREGPEEGEGKENGSSGVSVVPPSTPHLRPFLPPVFRSLLIRRAVVSRLLSLGFRLRLSDE